jgi:hypothetical protein
MDDQGILLKLPEYQGQWRTELFGNRDRRKLSHGAGKDFGD